MCNEVHIIVVCFLFAISFIFASFCFQYFLFFEFNFYVQFRFVYTWFLCSFQNVTNGLHRPFTFACAVGHAAAFAVNAALVASHWQHRA